MNVYDAILHGVYAVLHGALVTVAIVLWARKSNGKERDGNLSDGTATSLSEQDKMLFVAKASAFFDHSPWRRIYSTVRLIRRLDTLSYIDFLQTLPVNHSFQDPAIWDITLSREHFKVLCPCPYMSGLEECILVEIIVTPGHGKPISEYDHSKVEVWIVFHCKKGGALRVLVHEGMTYVAPYPGSRRHPAVDVMLDTNRQYFWR